MNQNSSLEKKVFSISGWITLVASWAIIIYFGYNIFNYLADSTFAEYDWWYLIKNVVLGIILPSIVLSGNVSLQRNDAVVYTFMGTYMGTLRGEGYFWVPFWFGGYSARNLATATIEVDTIKVNDKSGNPILIGGLIYCTEKDTHCATFDINGLKKYLKTKGDVALRSVAMSHPYDAEGEDAVSLKGNTETVLKEFKDKVTVEYQKAGYDVESVAITTLNYAPEIAGSMLQKQQAEATVHARETIAKGAVGIVKSTLKQLEDEKVVMLTDNQKQRLVSNLMVTICSAQPVAPVLNISEVLDEEEDKQ